MRRLSLKRWQKALLGIAGFVVAMIAVIIIIFTQTNYGRERARLFGLKQLASLVHGDVKLGRVHGNLLTGARIDQVVITDSTGRPFLQADTIIVRYSLLSLLQKRIVLHDVRVVHPVVVADQQSGQKWNFELLFPGDSTKGLHKPPAFGDWIRIDRLTVVRGDVSVSHAWAPPIALTGKARDSAIAHALSASNTELIVPAPGGYQALSAFKNVNGFFPLVVWADPDSAVRIVDVSTLSLLAQPFRPAPAEVRDMSGRVTIGADTVGFRNLLVTLPGSRVTINGNYSMHTADVNAVVHADPVEFADLHFVYPTFPDGQGRVDLAIALAGSLTRLIASSMDVHAEGAHVQGAIDLETGPIAKINSSNLTFAEVDTRVIRKFAPTVNVPIDGVLNGHLQLAGQPNDITVAGLTSIVDRRGETSRMTADGVIGNRSGGTFARNLRLQFNPVRVSLLRTLRPDLPVGGVITGRVTLNGNLQARFSIDADVEHADLATGRSHVRAAGEILTANGFHARNLVLRFEPLQVAVLRTFQPTLPLDGVITGSATLNGTFKGRISAVLDIAHAGSTGTSQLTGDAAATFADVLQQVDVHLRVQPLSLATVGLFLPAAGLHGTGAGTIVARGTRDDIQFTADLAVPQGGSLIARGGVALGDSTRATRYDIRSTLQRFDPSMISTRALAAQLHGTINATGRGTTLAAAVASVDVALADSRLSGTPRTDSTRLVAHLDNGLATIDRGHIRLASATGDIDGSFGLVQARTGTLHYRVAIDTLSRVTQFATRDTSVVHPRPAQQARRFAEARADSMRIARQTEVERAATGNPPEPALKVDSLRPLPRDSVAGIVRAQGTLAGNIEKFDADGTATLRDVLFRGNQLQSGDVTYKVTNAPGAQMGAALRANLTGVRLTGFGFDSAHVALNHTGGMSAGEGNFDLAIFQEPNRDYRIKSDFVLAQDRNELRLTDLSLRLDSTLWRAIQPGAVTWAASSGIGLRTIDLSNGHGGHIFADGTLPKEGSGDLQIVIDALQIGDIAALLQDTLDTRGMLSLHTRVRGTAREPLVGGTIALDSATRGGIRLPDMRGTFDYAALQLTASAQMFKGTQQLLNAEVKLPVDLALSGHQGSRLLDGPLSVDAHMDSLPLAALPSFTAAVENVRGGVRGDVAVRGTFKDPVLTGFANLTAGSVRIVEPGITLTNGAAALTFKDKQIVVDSLVATSGGGPLRASGTLDVSQFTRPGFDLQLQATNALMLNNKWGHLKANAAIAVKGPYDAVQVTGKIAVQSGMINAPEQTSARRATNLDDPTLVNVLDSLAVPLGDRRGSNPFLKNMQMDVAITVARDTWVRNSTANVEIYTPVGVDLLHVRVDNARQAITLEGTINADRGEYTIAGRAFKLTTGSATFLGTADIDPLLQLSAQYEVPRRNREALTILINIGGYLSAPRMTLSSNAQPPLPQSDLISYLAFGRTSTSLLSPEGSGIGGGGLGVIAQQQLAGLGVGAFTDAIVRGFEDQGTRAGLDVFRIHPGTLPDELNFGGYFQNVLRSTQIEAGKYVVPHLYAALEGHATAVLPGLRLEYESRGGFSWRATWEPRYLPLKPSLTEVSGATQAQQTHVFGAFLFWIRRF